MFLSLISEHRARDIDKKVKEKSAERSGSASTAVVGRSPAGDTAWQPAPLESPALEEKVRSRNGARPPSPPAPSTLVRVSGNPAADQLLLHVKRWRRVEALEKMARAA
eukprot:gene13889-biopygen14287